MSTVMNGALWLAAELKRPVVVLADFSHGHQSLQVLVGLVRVDVVQGAAVPRVSVGCCEVDGDLQRQQPIRDQNQSESLREATQEQEGMMWLYLCWCHYRDRFLSWFMIVKKQACLDLIDFYWLFGWNEPLRVQRSCPPEPKARTSFLHLWFLFILGLKLIRVKKIRMVLRTWAKLLVTFPLNRTYLFLLFSFLFSFCCVCSVLLLLLVSFCALAPFWLFSHCLWGLWVLCEAVRCLWVKCAV